MFNDMKMYRSGVYFRQEVEEQDSAVSAFYKIVSLLIINHAYIYSNVVSYYIYYRSLIFEKNLQL